MTTQSDRFAPTLKAAILENLLVAFSMPVLLVVAFFFLRGPGSVGFAVLFGGAWGLIWFGYLCYRFLRNAPSAVVVGEESLDFEGRGDSRRSLSWGELEGAVHGSEGGLHWTFTLRGGGEVLLRDDGFNVEQWDNLTRAIRARLGSYGVEGQVDGLGATMFEDDELEGEDGDEPG